jgi:hypothetical protein
MNTIEITSKGAGKKDFVRLKSVIACVSKDPTRAAINLVQVEAAKGGIVVTATDGRRLRSDRFKFKAEPGLYKIKTCNARTVFLVQSRDKMVFPNYGQVIPLHGKQNAYSLDGRGKKFVLWAASALGCYLDPKLVAVGEDEAVTLHIQKNAPHLSPVLVKNKTTTLVVMPITPNEPWTRELEAIKADLVRLREKEERQAA